MIPSRLVEYTFFFGLLGLVAYLVWKVFAPFAGALALSAVVVTICYPVFEWLQGKLPWKNKSVSSFLATIIVIILVVVPLVVLTSFLLREAISVYTLLNNGTHTTVAETLTEVEKFGQKILPGFQLNVAEHVQQFANAMATNITDIFRSTASTIFLFFIALIGIFFFFRDGKMFTKLLVRISPLPDDEDEIILSRLARSVRSVALGIALVAIIQGILTAIGLSIFGFERAVLWGSIAAIGALIPGVGTSIVFVPAIGFLILNGEYVTAGLLALWGAIAVGLIDNFLGPYLMSRGSAMHPFLILISVLGGIILFGPIGFILGPVSLSFLIVLLELYSTHITPQEISE